MTAFGVVRTSSSAVVIEPFIPWAAGVRTISAPRNASILRRSTDIDSGITSFNRYPRDAATKASAMPVLPEVGSINTVSGLITPAFSIATTIAAPMRSLTLAAGLKYSSFASMIALAACTAGKLRNRTIGVSPIASTMLSNTRPRPRECSALAGDEASMPNSCLPQFREFKTCSLIGAACLNVQVVNAFDRIRCVAKLFYCQNIVKPTHLCCEIVKEILLCKLRFKSQGGHDVVDR